MILDTSAILAILYAEPDPSHFARATVTANARRLSAATWLECAICIDSGRNPVASNAFDDFVRAAELRVEPVTEE